MLLTCVLFAICSSQRLRLLKSNINTQLHCKIVITLNGGTRNVGRFTRAAFFAADRAGSAVAEHRKIHPPLPRCKMLLNESLQSRLQLTHICVFPDALWWLSEFHRPQKFMREHKSATPCGHVICPDPIWPSDLYRLFSSFSWTQRRPTFDSRRSEPDSATTGANSFGSPRLTSCHRKQ